MIKLSDIKIKGSSFKYIALLIAVICFYSPLSSATSLRGANDPSRAPYYNAFKNKTVVFIPLGTGLNLTQAWSAVMRGGAERLGYKYKVRDPNWSSQAGAQMLTQAIAAKPNIIVVQPPDVQVYSNLIKKAEKAGIYVLQINLKSTTSSAAFIGPDWQKLGKVITKLAVEKCSPKNGGNGEIAVTQLTLTAASNIYQMQGVKEVLAKHPGMKLVSAQSGDTKASQTRHVTANVLRQHPNVCSIIGGWDQSDSGALAAVKAAGKDGDVYVVTSGGGSMRQCDKVEKAGGWSAYVSYDAARQGRQLNTMIQYLLQAKPPVGKYDVTLFSPLHIIDKAHPSKDACYSLGTLKEDVGK